jgi:hypothetical protein
MKNKCYSLVLLALALSVLGVRNANADFSVYDVINQFNQATGGEQFQYNYDKRNNMVMILENGTLGFVDTSAYVSGMTGGVNYFTTFTITPEIGTSASMSASLHYENDSTQTIPHNDVTRTVTLGAASLYARYATGALDCFDYPNAAQLALDAYDLELAIQTLTGSKSESWESNKFLAHLLEINDDQDYWLQSYDPARYYDEVGDYSVFVMNGSKSDHDPGQSFLYLAKQESQGSNVPEPASIILWAIGGFGILGGRMYWKRKKRLAY